MSLNLGIGLWEPLDPVLEILGRPVQPNEEQPFDRGSNGSGRWNQQNSRRFVCRNKAVEMDAHTSEVARNQNSTIFRRNPQNFWIESAIWDCTPRRLEIYRRLSSEQSIPYVGIDVSVSLKPDLQASLAATSFLARSKRSIIS
jgi:hypothetical protein